MLLNVLLDADFWANYIPPSDDVGPSETIDGETMTAADLAALLQ